MAQNKESVSADVAVTITGLITEFAWLVDHGRADEIAAIFTETARMTFGPGSPKPGTLVGIEAIKGFLAMRKSQTQVTSRHVMSNIRLRRESADRVVAESVLTLFRSDTEVLRPDPAAVADILEIYVRDETHGWRLQERTVTPIFTR